MKSILNQRFIHKTSKPSSLKLVVSINRSITDLGTNKDLYSFGKMLLYDVNFSFYDKKGLLTSGKLSGRTSYNIGKKYLCKYCFSRRRFKKTNQIYITKFKRHNYSYGL